MVTSWRVMSQSSMSDKPSNFLCFRNISLILKHEKLLRRSCRLKAVDDWNFIKNNTPSQFFNSYNEAYSNKTHYTLHLFWQNLSTHLVFISWVLPELRFNDILIQYLRSLTCSWWVQFITHLYKYLK